MNKALKVLKNQKGQGVWEYMVILVGIGAVALAVGLGMKSGLVGDGSGSGAAAGTTGKVVDGIGSLVDQAVAPTP